MIFDSTQTKKIQAILEVVEGVSKEQRLVHLRYSSSKIICNLFIDQIDLLFHRENIHFFMFS